MNTGYSNTDNNEWNNSRETN